MSMSWNLLFSNFKTPRKALDMFLIVIGIGGELWQALKMFIITEELLTREMKIIFGDL